MAKRYQEKLDCLGSKALLTIITANGDSFKDKIFLELTRQIQDFEKLFSRFLKSSELSKFNIEAGKKTKISPAMKNILLEVNKMTELTGGLFSPFILPTLQKVGYKNSWTNEDNIAPDFEDRTYSPDFRIEIGNDWAKIPSHSAIDLGGIGKGYMLDLLSAYLDNQAVEDYWLSLGGDIICRGKDINHSPWQINISDSLNNNLVVDYIENTNGQKLAIATSGVTKRKGIKDNKPWNHIIDPRLNMFVQNSILAVTVSAKNAELADVLAKCILIDGIDLAKKLINQKKIYGFLMQSLDKSSKIVIDKKKIN